jgi:hypothetical protein
MLAGGKCKKDGCDKDEKKEGEGTLA